MTMICIAMFLFSYVNSSMFWHAHHVQGIWFYHSHISDHAHRTDHTDGGHTTAQLIVLETVNQATYTETALPDFDLEPYHPAEVRMIVTPPAAHEIRSLAFQFSRRGPPVLV